MEGKGARGVTGSLRNRFPTDILAGRTPEECRLSLTRARIGLQLYFWIRFSRAHAKT
jgi:hypothetical protein